MTASTMLVEKWAEVLDKGPAIATDERRAVTATLIENTVQAISAGSNGVSLTSMLSEAAPSTNTAGVANYDPVLISMVRRTVPNLIAYDICGVQPMNMPTGLIFALRARYGTQGGTEAFYNEPNTAWSGTGTHSGTIPGTLQTGTGFTTANGEALGTGGASDDFAEMTFSVERMAVEAKTRALKAEYSHEMAQDLRNVHSMDAESELIKILTGEIVAEENRMVVRSIYFSAVVGAQDATTPGTFDLDVDANGRWGGEKYKGLVMQIEKEANAVGIATRRGKGNIVICSPNVASALRASGMMSYTPAMSTSGLEVDPTGNTFAGVLNGAFRIYVDPFAVGNFVVVGYKGASSWDAGIFYCPYIPLTLYRAVGENSFVPKIGFKTRSGLVANAFAGGATAANGAITANSNVFYRKFTVTGL